MQVGASMDVRAWSPKREAFVLVNVPAPVQPELPDAHWPVVESPCTVPVRVIVFPAGRPGCTVMPNARFTCPLKFPFSVMAPVPAVSDSKHEELVLKLKLETVTEPSPFACSVVPNSKLVVLPLLRGVAFQFPLMLAGLELERHPTRARPAISKTSTANCLISNPPGTKSKGRHTGGCAASEP
jgi:hypothetical protein